MLLLLLCNVFTLSAAEELYAQHYNVTLSLRNATVKEAVDAVTRQTGIAFSYESSVGVMPLGNVEIRVDGGAVDAVLGPLFADKGIAWQVVDGVVILTRQNSPPQSDSGRRLTVRGRITACLNTQSRIRHDILRLYGHGQRHPDGRLVRR